MHTMYPRRSILATTLVVALLGQAELGLGAYDQATDSLPLTQNSGTLSPDGTHLLIKLDAIELNALKKNRNIATGTTGTNTYASAGAGLVTDLAASANPSVLLTEENAYLVRNFQNDITEPELVHYELDMDKGYLDLSFTETVKVEELELDSFTLYSEQSTPATGARESYELSTLGDAGTEDGTFIRVMLTNDDLNAIKKLSELASSDGTTFLAMAATAIKDMNDNPVIAIADELARGPLSYKPDVSDPTLLACELNMNSAKLTLSFSETVDVGKTVCTSLYFYGDATYNGRFTVGADCNVENKLTYDHNVVVELSSADMNALKAQTNIATAGKDAGTPNTYCAIAADGIADMSLNVNTIAEITKVNAVGASFLPDATPPTLTNFHLNMDSGDLTLTFSETVKASTVIAGQHITFTDEENAPSLGSYLLKGGITTIPTVESPIVTIALTLLDMNEIKRLKHIGTKTSNSVMTITADAFASDMTAIALVFSSTTKIPANDVTSVVTVDATPPTLDSASIDMDTRTLTLEFSETVEASELEIEEFVLVNGKSGDTNYRLTGYDSISADSSTIEIILTVGDMNSIKAETTLFSDPGSSYIDTAGDVVPFKDMAGNEALQIATADAVGPLGWVKDTTDPTLDSWSVSIDKKKLWLTFDETVFARNFEPTEVTLHGTSNDAGQKYTLSGDSAVASDHAHSTIVEITIGNDDMNAIKAFEGLLVGVGTSYLQLGRNAVLDMEDRQVVEVTAVAPKPVSADGYEGDKTAPGFTGYTLDMDRVSPLLTLSFDETVRLDPVVATEITFVGTNGQEFALSGITMLGVNSDVVQGEISVEDSNKMKALYHLATSVIDTNSLKLGAGAFRDMEKTVNTNGHPNVETTHGIVTNPLGYTVDGIAPILDSYTLNMASKVLSMTFAETVDPTIVAAKFKLVDSVGKEIALGASATSSGVGTVIDIDINEVDTDDIMLDTDISANEGNTYLTVDAGAISDAAGNPIEAIDSKTVAGLGNADVRGYFPDTERPNLLTVTVNMDRSVNGADPDVNEADVNAATITFNFDEPVNAIGGFAANAVTLVATDDANVANPPSYTLDNAGTWTLSNGRQVILTLDTRDLNKIKAMKGLFTDTGTSFVTIAAGLVNDMAGNAVVAKTAHTVGSFDDDSTAPVITDFTVNMATGVLTMTFQETVEEASLILTKLRLQQQYECVEPNCEKGVTLTGGIKMGDGNGYTELAVMLSDDDKDEIKRKSICLKTSSKDKCWLAVEDNAVQDMNQQYLTSVTNGVHGKKCKTLIEDTIPPELDAFTFDIDGLLIITFTETVDFSELQIDEVVLQSAECTKSVAGNCADTGDNFVLTKVSGTRAGSTIIGTSNKILQIQLGLDDKNDIKQIVSLATIEFCSVGASAACLHISFGSLFVKDMTGNPITAVGADEGKEASGFTDDETNPTLDFFTIDMSGTVAQLSLTFSETVKRDSLKPQNMVLQSTIDGLTGESFGLTDGTVSALDSTVVTVDLIHSDRTSLEALLELAFSDTTTYLSFKPVGTDGNGVSNADDVVITDMRGNPVDHIASGAAKITSDYFGDVTPPSLVSFTLDLHEETLVLSFSETIDIASLKLDGTGFTLLNTPLCDATDGVSLDMELIASVPISGDTVSTDGPEAVIKLTLDTLNAIKSKTSLATLANLDNTYLAVYPGAVSDTVAPDKNVFATQVTCATPKRAISFNGDNMNPELNTGFSLNMRTGKMVLYFSETVDFNTFEVTELTLTDGASKEYTLTSSSTKVSASIGGKVVVQISDEDLNRIKMTDAIAKTQVTTFVYFSEELVDDMNGNAVISTVGNAKGTFETVLHPGTHYVSDIDSPNVDRIDLDLKLGTMTLYFDEAVRVSSLDMEELSVLAGTDVNSASETMSTDTQFAKYITNDEGTIIEVALTQADLDKLKLKPLLAISVLTTIFSVTEALISDYQGNAMAVPAKFPAGDHIADTTKPTLVSFSIEMTDEELTLTFSEAVNALSLQATGLTLQDSKQAFVSSASSAPDYAHRLQGGIVTSSNGYIQVIKMDTFDLNHLKRLSRVATSTEDTFILIDAGTVQDLNSQDVVGITDGDAVKSNDWKPDGTPPELDTYRVVMDASGPPLKLYLKFTETVDVTKFDVTKIVLQDTADSSDRTVFHRLTGYEEVNVVPLPNTLSVE